MLAPLLAFSAAFYEAAWAPIILDTKHITQFLNSSTYFLIKNG